MYDSGPYVGVTDEDLQPVSVADYWKQSWNDGRRVSNMAARALNLTEAFDEVNEKIAKATGVKDLANPLQGDVGLFQPARRPEQAPVPGAIDKQPLDIWKDRVRELQKLHPDALPWDQIIDEPGRKALERMKSIREETSALDDRAGMASAIQRPELGWLDKVYSPSEQFIKNMIRRPDLAVAGLGASFAAAMTSPLDAAVNFLGFGAGGKAASLAKNALINATVNAAGQAPLSAFKQLQYKEAQLPYGWDQWTREVAGAGVAGGIIDVSVRGPARAVKALTGRTEGLGGVFTDAPRPLPLPEQPKVRPDIPDELLERARNDDLEAIKEVARLTGVDQDPAVKGAIHYAETTGPIDAAIAQRFRELGVDDGEGLRVLADAMRGDRYVRPLEPTAPAAEPRMRDVGERILMEREAELQGLIQGLDQRLQQRVVDAVEAGIPRVVALVQERLEAAKGDPAAAREGLVAGLTKAADEMGGPERFAAMVDLYAGRGDIRSTAQAIRDFPDLVDSNLSSGSDLIQAARAISKLEPEAFALFQSGEASPGVARVVSDLVPPDQQARVMDDMRRAGIETEADARQVVRDLVRPARDASDVDAPLSRGSKIDDPAGPEAKAQTDRLMKEHAEAVKEAQAPIKAREKLESEIEDLKGQIAKLEEKAAKAAPKPEERYADPTTGEPLSKGDVDSIVSMWSYVAEQKKARKPETLTAFLIDVGRLQDQGGELTNMLGGKSRHLISGEGMALDDAALKAYEAGFFPERPDISTFLEAVRDDLNGNPRVREIDFNWLEDFREAQKMEQDLAEFGILKAKSEAEVRDAFRSKPEGEGAGGARGDQAAAGRAEDGPLYALGEEDLAKLAEAHGKLRDLQAQHVEASRGSPLFELVLDAARMQRRRDVNQAINTALRLADRVLPEGVKVEIRSDELRNPETGQPYPRNGAGEVVATSHPITGDIELATYAMNPAARLSHEAVHTLVTRGLLSPEEVALLAKAGRKAGVFEAEAAYREAYKGRANLDRQIEEEAAAHYIDAIVSRQISDGVPRTLIQKIQQIIERIRNVLNGYGFRTETDVVRAILEGDAAARKSVQAWMRSSDISAIAVRKPEAMYALGDDPKWAAGDAHVEAALAKVGATRISLDEIVPQGQREGASLVIARDGSIYRLRSDTDQGGGHAGIYRALEGEPSPLVRVTLFTGSRGPQIAANSMWGMLKSQVNVVRAIAKNYGVDPRDLVVRRNLDTVEALEIGVPQSVRENPSITSYSIPGAKPLTGESLNGLLLDQGKLFAFGGEKAETANLDALARAKDLEASGMDRDNIWTLTGWGRGVDGKWRFEIDDSDAGFSAKASLRRKSGNIAERFEHPDLYAAYPALRALDLFWDPELDPKTQLGGFSPDTGVVSLAANLPSRWTTPVLLHELQHGVQEMERFGRGASMAETAVSPARVESWLQGWDGDIIVGTYFERDITMSAAKVIDGFDGGGLEQLRNQVLQLIERGETTLEAASAKIAQQMQTDAYVRNSGEVEARLVETRMDMTPEQRRERPFWYDYDVLEAEQTVKRQGAMYAMQDAATGREMRRELDQLGFYSQALEAAKGLKQNKGTPEQMRAQLRSAGVKEAELVAVGLDGFLEGKKSVAKDDLIRFLEENRVEVRESYYSDETAVRAEEEALAAKYRANGMSPDQAAITASRVMDKRVGRSGDAKWSSYSIDPSNPTYRETVIHLPDQVKAANDAYTSFLNEMRAKYARQDATGWGSFPMTADERAKMERLQERAYGFEEGRDPRFHSGHWTEPNVVVHARSSLQRTADGKPVFVIDNLQSDWGQRLRDGGVRDEAKIADLQNRIDQAHEDIDAYLMGEPLAFLRQNVKHYPQRTNPGEVRNILQQIQRDGGVFVKTKDITPEMRAEAEFFLTDARFDNLALLQAELRTAEAAVSGHPLVNTTDQWVTTGLRRMIRQAVEAGADYIAFSPSEPLIRRGEGTNNPEAMRNWQDVMLPRAMSKLLGKIDKDVGKAESMPLHSSLDGRVFNMDRKEERAQGWNNLDDFDTVTKEEIKGSPPIQFHTFPLTEKIKREVGGYGQALFAMDAFHGSPHDFDRFSLEHLGRGEGAQAFGPGLYFAENIKVAKSYASKLGPRQIAQITLDGAPVGVELTPTPEQVAARQEKIKAINATELRHGQLQQIAANLSDGKGYRGSLADYFEDFAAKRYSKNYYASEHREIRGNIDHNWASDAHVSVLKDGSREIVFDYTRKVRGKAEWRKKSTIVVDREGVIREAGDRFLTRDVGARLEDLIGFSQAYDLMQSKGGTIKSTFAFGGPNKYDSNNTPALAAAKALEYNATRADAIARQEADVANKAEYAASFSGLNPFNGDRRRGAEKSLVHAQQTLKHLKDGTEEKGVPYTELAAEARKVEAQRAEDIAWSAQQTGEFIDKRFKAEWLQEEGFYELGSYKSRQAFEKAHDDARLIANDKTISDRELIEESRNDITLQVAVAIRELRQLEKDGRLTWTQTQPEGAGIYQVKLHVEPEQLLDWDKPLSQQPPFVAAALKSVVKIGIFDRLKSLMQRQSSNRFGISGKGTVADLIHSAQDKEQLRRMLLAAGIPGIRYFDASSRKAGEGSRNYVIFDDTKIEITHKNGQPISAREKASVVEEMKQPSYSGFDEQGNMLFAMSDERRALFEAEGFDTSTVMYHGTPRAGFNANAFDVSKHKGRGNNGFKGVSLSPNPEVASGYTGAWLSQELVKSEKQPLLSRLGLAAPKEELVKTGRDLGEGRNAAAVYPVLVRVKNPFVVDTAEGFHPVELPDRYAYTEDLERQGYDALRIVHNGKLEELVVFDPKNIRSVNAAFDPAKADSPNLMFAMSDEPRIPLHDDMEAIARYDAVKELVEACR